MRIIGGKFGKRRIEVPKGLDCRPTTDKAKESLFNILQNRIDFEGILALDLFAGTGSLSYELVSRECRKVVSVEKNSKQLSFIHKVKEKFGMPELEIRKADALKFLERHSQQYDFIFMDPPYDYEHYDRLVELIYERNLLANNGIFIIEHDARHDFSDHSHFSDQRNYSKVNFTFFS